jgi:hypothetical protein
VMFNATLFIVLYFLFLDIVFLAVALDFFMLHYKSNLRTVSLDIKINLYSLRNRLEKLAKGSLFYLFLKLVQINFIFSDNVRILYIWYQKRFIMSMTK